MLFSQSPTLQSPHAEVEMVSGNNYAIGIAGLRVVKAPDTIRTVLGSCIGIALFDRVAKLGGMAHIILPDSNEGSGDPKKFADTAVDLLLEELVSVGAEPRRITAKLAGGADMFGQSLNAGLGDRNAEAVTKQLLSHQIRIAGRAIGGMKGRRMQLNPQNGEVHVQVIGEPTEVI